MSNKPIGYQTTSFTPDVPGTGSRSEKLAELEPKRKGESRSKRVQILITPTTYEKLKSIAENKETSINEIINISIESYIRKL